MQIIYILVFISSLLLTRKLSVTSVLELFCQLFFVLLLVIIVESKMVMG